MSGSKKKPAPPLGLELLHLDDIYPIAILQDRYLGAYSKGEWFAIMLADAPYRADDLDITRGAFCLDEGPNGSDEEAASFWKDPPHWIAVGNTPQEALDALRSNP